jgi:hypothetical protein
VSGVSDQDDRVAVRRIAPRLDVHLRDERAGRVDRPEPARGRVPVDGRGDAVRREDDGRALRRLLLALDEDRAALLELAHDVGVVDDLLADVDGRSRVLERELDRLDGALDPGAIPARRSKENPLDHDLSVTLPLLGSLRRR